MDDEALFHLALEKPSGERSSFLERACPGDEALRRRVEALLRSHAIPDSFLAGPAVTPTAAADPSGGGWIEPPSAMVVPGARIGPYKLLQSIGEGGMGTVYMAEQTTPVRRTVALKPIKAGMDSRQVLARFGAERQALALMDHPNIAKVLDAGSTDAGRPYFVMELVKGIPITRFCDEQRLSTRERLELAIPVCQAVQHAHQKGVIHRDLKPSNVLVALYDDKPVPKVIDFGVAKATGPRLTDQTLYTEFGAIVGTLEYMSPEQARLNQLDIDTRSDIYSLGVLLYELLTGSTPLDRRRMTQAAFLEVLRVIREEESQRPSLRLSTTEELPSIAACRRIEPRKLSGLMRGELDWIVMKALEKDRNRRYETANGLAADLRRYLDDEPVQACPPSAVYRIGKFARRHRLALTMAAVAVLVLVLAVVVLALSNVRIHQEKAQKERALLLARASEENAIRLRRQAQTNLSKARQAVDQMLTRVAQERLFQVPQMEQVRRTLLEDALRFYRGFLLQEATDPGLSFEAAAAHYRLGNLQRELGQPQRAIESFRRSIDLLAPLAREFPGKLEYRSLLGETNQLLGYTLTSCGRPREAEASCREALVSFRALVAAYPADPNRRYQEGRTVETLSGTLHDLGRPLEAEKEARRGVAIFEKLAAEFPTGEGYRIGLANCRRMLGYILWSTGRPSEAETSFRQALEMSQSLAAGSPKDSGLQHTLCANHMQLAETLVALGHLQGAAEQYRRAFEIAETLVADFPGFSEYRLQLGTCRDRLVDLLISAHPEQLDELWRRAVTVWAKLAADFPKEPAYRAELAAGHKRLAALRRELGQHGRAIESFRLSIDLLVPLVKESPGKPEYRSQLAEAYRLLGLSLGASGRAHEVESCGRKALDLSQALADDFPADPANRLREGTTAQTLGDTLIQLGRLSEAEAEERRGLSILEKLVVEFPAVSAYRSAATNGRRGLGAVLRTAGRLREAESEYRQALEASTKLAAETHSNVESKHVLCANHMELADVLIAQGHSKEAIEQYRRALEIAETLVVDSPGFPEYRRRLGICGSQLRSLLKSTGHPEEAEALSRRIIVAFEKAAARLPSEPFYQDELAGHYVEAGRHTEAEKAYGKAIDLGEKQTADPPSFDCYMHAHSYIGLAVLLARSGRGGEAEKVYGRARAFFQGRATEHPAFTEYRHELGRIENALGGFLQRSGRLPESEQAYRQARDIYEKLTSESLDKKRTRWARQELMWTNASLARLLLTCRRSAEAERAMCEAIAVAEKLDTDFPNQGYSGGVSLQCNNLAWLLATCQEPAIRDPGRAVGLARRAVGLAAGEGMYWNTLGVAHYRADDWKAAIEALAKSTDLRKGGDGYDWFFLAMAHWQLGDKPQARSWFDKAVPWMEKHQPKDGELLRFRTEAAALLGVKEKSG